MTLWLVGVGSMAREYAKVLGALGKPYEAIGRGETSAASFAATVGQKPIIGGLDAYLRRVEASPSDEAIVAVGVAALASCTVRLLDFGVRRILVEKPAGMNSTQITALARRAAGLGAEVFVAYNRRWYASALAARRMVEEDGGVTSFSFEFTEWSHRIGPLEKAPGVKERWFLCNSTHVVDLAFHLAGWPARLSTYVAGGLDWHPSSSVFAGAGVTHSGALFGYQANWTAPGRWSVELCTKKRRLVLRPLETLQIQQLGSVNLEPVAIDDTLDRHFKPGLRVQTERFLSGETDGFCTIAELVEHVSLYDRIAGYEQNQ